MIVEPGEIRVVADVLDGHWPATPPHAAAGDRDRRRWAIDDAAKDVLERLDDLGWFKTEAYW